MADAERPILLVAAHGERGGAGDNVRLASIADAAGALLPGWDVRHGVLSGTPALEDALSGPAVRTVAVWPFFMCRGYFTDTVLKKRLDGLGLEHVMLDVLGESRSFVDLTCEKLLREAGHAPASVLVIAHGSTKGTQSRLAAEKFAGQLAEAGPFPSVTCAYLEEPPFAADAIASLPQGAGIVSLFAGDGLHGGQDLDEILAKSGRSDLTIVTPAADVQAVARIVAGAVVNRLDAFMPASE